MCEGHACTCLWSIGVGHGVVYWSFCLMLVVGEKLCWAGQGVDTDGQVVGVLQVGRGGI